jgi:hypothetical protein
MFYLFILLPSLALAQEGSIRRIIPNSSIGENTSLSNTYVLSGPQKAILSRGDVSFVYYGLQLTALENEILDMEGLERHALLKRDTAALRQIWQRDFTLDAPQNKVIAGPNPLPYYIALSRLVERCTPVGDLVFTSGFEFVQELKPNGQLDAQVKRSFFHAWSKRFGQWKLSTNSHE